MIVREGGHRGQAVGAPGQGHQQRAQEHGQGVTHAPRVARIGELGQFVGQGTQGLQVGGVVACDNVFHEGCSVSREVVTSPHKTHGGPLCGAGEGSGPAAGADYPYCINANGQWICAVLTVPGQHPEPVSDSPDSSPSRDFAFALTPTDISFLGKEA